MIAQNTMKVNGKWFYAGQEITGLDLSSSDFSKCMTMPEEWKVPQDKTYTKTEINRMPTSELRILAKGKGIDNAEDMTGGELKNVLIEILGL